MSQINIAATQYSPYTKSFEIYVAGCKGECDGCHNPELRDYSMGSPMTMEYMYSVRNKIVQHSKFIDRILILGGDPMDQNLDELRSLLLVLQEAGKPVYLFTRYELEDIPDYIQFCCDYIKCGKFDLTKLVNDNMQYGIQLASSNQTIYARGIDYAKNLCGGFRVINETEIEDKP